MLFLTYNIYYNIYRACYLEIYNEKVIDLLEKKNKKTQTKKIEIQKDGLCITPLKAIVCQNSQMVPITKNHMFSIAY